MKTIYYPAFSEKILICSPSWNGEESEFFKYFKTITEHGEAVKISSALMRLGNETLNKRNKVIYHGFKQYRDPDLFVLKSKPHRFFLIYDTVPIKAQFYAAAVVVCCMRKHSDNYTKKEYRSIDAARMKYWGNRLQCIVQETKEEF